MNINTKAILVSTIFIALFAGTTAFAEDRDNLFAWELNATPTEAVEMQKVNFQAPSVSANDEVISSGRR